MINTVEIWKDIKNYEGLYQVSNLGRIKSLGNKINHKNSIYLKKRPNKYGYEYVILQNNKKKKSKTVHRLVAEAFISNLENKKQVNHIDGNKLNNNVDNLEWSTPSENIKHSFRTGLKKPTRKQVYQYDLNNNLIAIYNSTKEAGEKSGILKGSIAKCCRKELKTSGGYKWEYTK